MRHSITSNVQILQATTKNTMRDQETRIRPYIYTSQSFKGGNLTERHSNEIP